jgi:signal transduction histidine kinase
MTPAAAQAPARPLLVGFAAVVVILAAAFTAGEIHLRNVRAAIDSVHQCEELEVTLQRLMTTMIDAEAGQRGFIISGAPGYLEPYVLARLQIARHLAKVGTFVGDSRDDQADLHRISAAVQVKLDELAKVIELRQQAAFDAAQAVRITNGGKQTLDELRAVVARMHAREASLLAARSADANTLFRSTRVTGLLGTVLAIAAVGALFVRVSRHEAALLHHARTADAEQLRLREVLRQQDDFVAIVSHELRTPTTAIAGRARMLERNHLDADRAAEAVAAIARNADSLRHLIDDLTDATQLVAGRMRLTIGPVDWARVVRDAVDAVRLSAEDKSVTLIEEIEPELPVLIGDSERLKQVVWNLLANSIKFTPGGGMVRLVVKRADDSIALEVRDSGQGIPQSFLPHVFDRFRQGPAAGARGGVGLGLAIVRHIVELHGGQVTVQSEGVDQGATFVVALPTVATVQTGMGSGMFER